MPLYFTPTPLQLIRLQMNKHNIIRLSGEEYGLYCCGFINPSTQTTLVMRGTREECESVSREYKPDPC